MNTSNIENFSFVNFRRKINKRGDYKYGILLSLILGLLVLSLSLYFIFNEYFNSSDLDREICRQSIQVRSLLPEATISDYYQLKSFKDDFPLKCKTEVVEIDEREVQNKDYEKIIGDTIAGCWALYDKGDESAFPASPKLYGSSLSTTCVPCARIHFTEDAKRYVLDEGIEINIRSILDGKMTGDYSYFTYLRDSGRKFPAFNPASGREFDFDGDSFFVDEGDSENVQLINRLTGEVEGGNVPLANQIGLNKVNLPRNFNVENGDLIINYGIITSSQSGGIGPYIPYLFYFQADQDPSPFDEIKKELVDGPRFNNADFCESWEGIPA